MCKENIKCPICGKVNEGLNLEETYGWMECIKCKSIVQVQIDKYTVEIPVLGMVSAQFRGGLFTNSEWMPYRCYCPNCGNLLVGYKNNEGTVKYSCDKCLVHVVRREKSRRRVLFETIPPAV